MAARPASNVFQQASQHTLTVAQQDICQTTFQDALIDVRSNGSAGQITSKMAQRLRQINDEGSMLPSLKQELEASPNFGNGSDKQIDKRIASLSKKFPHLRPLGNTLTDLSKAAYSLSGWWSLIEARSDCKARLGMCRLRCLGECGCLVNHKMDQILK